MAISTSLGMLIVVAAAAALAAALSGWMFVDTFGMKGLPGCGAGSDCETVARGRWSRWGAVPVSGLGIVVYAFLLVAAISVRFGATGTLSSELLIVCSLLAVGSAIWFIVLQAFVIRRFCMYCMVVHVCGLVVAVMVFSHVDSWSLKLVGLPLKITSIGMAILVLGQIFLKPRTYAMIPALPAEIAPEPETLPVEIYKMRPSKQMPSDRKVVLHRGRVHVPVDGWPLIGSPDAEHVIVWLFDFTCRECQHLHRLLREAVRHFDGALAVLAIPVPQHSGCNSTIKTAQPAHVQACQYARLSLAVWTACPEGYDEWDQFMAKDLECQPFGLAFAKAKELANRSGVELRDADAALDQRIEQAIAIFIAAVKPKIPSIILSTGVLSGHIPDARTLIKLLNKHGSIARRIPVVAVGS